MADTTVEKRRKIYSAPFGLNAKWNPFGDYTRIQCVVERRDGEAAILEWRLVGDAGWEKKLRADELCNVLQNYFLQTATES